MKLEDAVRRLSSGDRKHIAAAATLLRVHGSGEAQRFMANADAEFRLSELAWQTIFKSVLTVDISDEDRDTADRVLTAFRVGLADCLTPIDGPAAVPNRTPAGEEISGLNPKAFGRLVPLDALRQAWKAPAVATGRPSRVKKSVARDLIQMMSRPDGFAALQTSRNLENLPLGRYVIWSTFDGQALSTNPFPNRPLRISDLAALMGLDYTLLFPGKSPASKHRSSCVILTYMLPGTVKPYIPSIVEAYAGTFRLNYYFHLYQGTVDIAKRHFPRTLPTPSAQTSHGAPEVVHSVIAADQLSAPIEIARFH